VSLVPTYRSRDSALHASRAGVGAAFCCAFAFVGALYEHPLVLAAALVGVVLAGRAAGVGREIGSALKLSLPLALLVAIVNPLVYPEGDTLLVRGGELLGRRFDVTLEALAAGALAGLRVTVIVTALGLLSAAVDPDELLRLFRRFSYRSALSASLATRLVPVLARDAMRMGEAARCRPVRPSRLAAVRAALSSALERSTEVAAALEVRGYSLAGPAGSERTPWSRHDLRVAAAAVAATSCALAAKLAGAGWVEPYPRLELAFGSLEMLLALSLLGCAAFPFAGRAARMGVARA
jgi:energy-coupling factor transport system permease protein